MAYVLIVPAALSMVFGVAYGFVGTIKCQVTVAGSDTGAIEGEVDLTFLP